MGVYLLIINAILVTLLIQKQIMELIVMHVISITAKVDVNQPIMNVHNVTPDIH
jgi:hypothetical protein